MSNLSRQLIARTLDDQVLDVVVPSSERGVKRYLLCFDANNKSRINHKNKKGSALLIHGLLVLDILGEWRKCVAEIGLSMTRPWPINRPIKKIAIYTIRLCYFSPIYLGSKFKKVTRKCMKHLMTFDN